MLTAQRLTKPKSQMALILFRLIQGKEISERQFQMNSFRSRISNLRLDYGVPIRHAQKEFTNEFGHKGTYRKHFILSIDRERAIRTYIKINQ